MSTETHTVGIRLAWWVQPYLQTLAFCCLLTGLEPDMDAVERVVMRGLRVVSLE